MGSGGTGFGPAGQVHALTHAEDESPLSSTVFPWPVLIQLLREIIDLCRPQERLCKAASVKEHSIYEGSPPPWRKQPGNVVRLIHRASSFLPGKDQFPGREEQSETPAQVLTTWVARTGQQYSAFCVPQLDLLHFVSRSFPKHSSCPAPVSTLYKLQLSSLHLSPVLCIWLLCFSTLTNLSCFPINTSTVHLFIDKND